MGTQAATTPAATTQAATTPTDTTPAATTQATTTQATTTQAGTTQAGTMGTKAATTQAATTQPTTTQATITQATTTQAVTMATTPATTPTATAPPNTTNETATTARTPTTVRPTTAAPRVTTPARPEPEQRIVPSVLSMQLDFTPALRDETSPVFVELSVEVTKSLTAIYIGIRGFIEIIIIGFVPGSVEARYVAVFAADQAESDSVIQEQARANLTAAIDGGNFNTSLNVTDAQALQRTTLTQEELDKVTTGSSFCTLTCGDGARCQLTAQSPSVLSAECVCEQDYCHAGTCEVIVDQGPRCTCPATMGSWYSGEKCDNVLTQLAIIGIAVGCLCFGLVCMCLAAVYLAKREKNFLRKEKKKERYRYEPPGIVLENYNVYNPEMGQPAFQRAALGRDDYREMGSEVDLFPAKSPLYTDSLRDRGRPRQGWNPSVNNLPAGQFKIPRPATAYDKVFPKDEDHCQSFEINFAQTGGEETKM
ncbi:mucin-17-like [Branchiostoma floridae]|uniref:Mucin-17-like n=1 Tax=Branchiostoma floridae TaxID=7739 RepID=A0A9J7N2L4_BRAFL|nr:mucin-17-like [Branchiostoma floridae]